MKRWSGKLTENLQREDLRPMDEARGYRQLMDLGHSVDDLASSLKRSKSSIYARLKLLELPEMVKIVVDAGKLPPSHAELVLKIENQEEQEKLITRMLEPKSFYSQGETVTRDVMSFRDAKALVEGADQAQQAEKAWQEKTKEYGEGYEVLPLSKVETVYNYGSLRAGFVGVNATCDLDPQKRTWKSLAGKHAPKALVVKQPYQGGIQIVYRRKPVEKALTLAGYDFAGTSAAELKENAAAREQREREEKERQAAMKFAKDSEQMAKLVGAAEAREPNAELWRLIVDKIDCDELESLLKRRGIPMLEKDSYQKASMAFERFIAKADGKTLRGVAVELMCWGWRGLDEEVFKQTAKAVGLKVQTSAKKKRSTDEEED